MQYSTACTVAILPPPFLCLLCTNDRKKEKSAQDEKYYGYASVKNYWFLSIIFHDYFSKFKELDFI